MSLQTPSARSWSSCTLGEHSWQEVVIPCSEQGHGLMNNLIQGWSCDHTEYDVLGHEGQRRE
jgi:hypothetical protein